MEVSNFRLLLQEDFNVSPPHYPLPAPPSVPDMNPLAAPEEGDTGAGTGAHGSGCAVPSDLCLALSC